MNISVIAGKNAAIVELQAGLTREGFACTFYAAEPDAIPDISRDVDVLLLEVDGRAGAKAVAREVKQVRNVPIIALMRRETLPGVNGQLDNVDDFVLYPYDAGEVKIRATRALHKINNASAEVLRCGDLLIDQAKCEVTAGGRIVILTFREYELLKFLVTSKGRTFTRNMLLDKVWGYDYLGGDRTVDVHIRRLRSKIEDATHTYIETVRNIGYRFHEDA